MREVIERATASFEDFEFAAALETIESFFWSSFTDNYIELAKRRARDETDPVGQASAIATLRLGLSVCVRLFAPYVPSIADEVWSWVFADEAGVPSVHIANWPTTRELEHVEAPSDAESFRSACDAIASVRKAKSERSIGLGKPPGRAKVQGWRSPAWSTGTGAFRCAERIGRGQRSVRTIR